MTTLLTPRAYDVMYVAGSTVSGSVGIATVNLSWILSRTSWSLSDETNEMARPLVPNRPARPTRCK